MPDFTSSLYLGLRHASTSLRPWTQLTAGRPAALRSPPGARDVASSLAALQGCEYGTLGRSTLHLFVDLFTMLAGPGVGIVMDAQLYPIARWGIERAALRGVPIRRFPHHNAHALSLQVENLARFGLSPVVATDGVCPDCARPAPLEEYLEIVRRFSGRLIVDDSQALGILGRAPNPHAPYGRGGGGSLPWFELAGREIIAVSSLAKSFGVPIAVLVGSREAVRLFESRSEARVHCSPPSMAAFRAAEHALAVNRQAGDELRRRLARRVRYFRDRMAAAGMPTIGGLFPVQTLAIKSGANASFLHAQLLRHRVRAVLRRDLLSSNMRLTFVLTASHHHRDIDRAVDTVKLAAARKKIRLGPVEVSHV